VAVGVDGAFGKRVVLGDGAVRLDAQDLAPERAPVLGVTRVARIARAHVEHPVGPELDPTPVVIRVDGNAREYGLGPLARPEPDHAVVPLGRVVGIDVAVVLVIGGNGDAEQTSLARPSLGQGLDLPDLTGWAYPEEPARVALRDEGVAIGQERERPRHPQVRDQGAHLDPLRGSLAGPGARFRLTGSGAPFSLTRPGGVRLRLTGVDRLRFAATVFLSGLVASGAQENEQDR
jgi:hypothetical protein